MKRLAAVETARRVLEDAEAYADAEAPSAELLRELLASVRGLLGILDEQSRSERLAAQQDEEFRGLVRATLVEIRALVRGVERLDAFGKALAAMLAPQDGDER